jgi:hypothetical protein
MSMAMLWWMGGGFVLGLLAVFGVTALVRSGQQYDDELARDDAALGVESAGIEVREEPDRRQNIALRELVDAGERLAHIDEADIREVFHWVKALNDLRAQRAAA